jgi:hypothetical protein
LKGFKRVHLNAGESKTVQFAVAKSEARGDTVTVSSLQGSLPK